MESIHLMTLFILAFALGNHGRSAETSSAAEESERAQRGAVEAIDRALEKKQSTANASDQAAQLRDAATNVMDLAQHNQAVQSILKHALAESHQQSPDQVAKILRNALREAREILAFQPIIEAPTPQGFPQWTPVGQVRVQRYPNYRAARSTMSDGEHKAFWTLFRHIESNKIAMTAPVEMSYEGTESNEPRESSMAFLYANTEVGHTGSAGTVSVVDLPAATVVSIGVRGDITPKVVGETHSQLKAWLADYSGKYEVCGELRVLGYNSPMIPLEKRYFEVQLPLRELPPFR